MLDSPSAWNLLGATRSYGSRVALAPTDLRIRKGEKIGLIGPSGSGKSTLLKLLAGSLRPSSGQITTPGGDLAALSNRNMRAFRRQIGIVHQANVMLPQLSVHQNVIAGLLPEWGALRVLLASLWPLEQQRVAQVLQEVGLGSRQWELTGNLSGGEQQRVAVARALVGDPELLLADEPTASLDPTNAAQVARLIFGHSRRTVLFCSHWVSVIIELADRIIGLRDGQVVLDSPAADLTENDLDLLYAGSNERR